MAISEPSNYDLEVKQDPRTKAFYATFNRTWATWFTEAWQILFAVSQSGVTADRPTKLLWPGRPYFDTSLGAHGKPIWVNKTATGWVLADGTVA